MILEQTEALRQLAEIWQQDAQTHRRWAPGNPQAELLDRCASELRRVLGSAEETWVPLDMVEARTGWSRRTLQRRCAEELKAKGAARKSAGGEWEVTLDAALDWPIRKEGPDLASMDSLQDMARALGRE